jgi:RNA polymerase sigma-70 factor (ECF subfamily)
VVLRAGATNLEEAHTALDQLCRDYWFPVYAYVRRKGHSPDDSADLTQGFFARLLEDDFVRGVLPEGGRFRSFLVTALNRFLINEWKRGQRLKRGGGTFVDSLEELIAQRGEAAYLAEASHQDTPESLYHRAWAETLFGRALERMAEECASRGDDRFEPLRPYLAIGDEPPLLTETAAQLGLSLPAFKSLLYRFRQRYRELLLEEVRQTVPLNGDAAEELRGLLGDLRTR